VDPDWVEDWMQECRQRELKRRTDPKGSELKSNLNWMEPMYNFYN